MSADGRALAIGGVDKSVVVCDVVPGALLPRHALQLGGVVQSLAFSPDGRYLASGSEDQRAHVWLLPERDDLPDDDEELLLDSPLEFQRNLLAQQQQQQQHAMTGGGARGRSSLSGGTTVVAGAAGLQRRSSVGGAFLRRSQSSISVGEPIDAAAIGASPRAGKGSPRSTS